jgi:hypothetical protein
MNSIPHEPLDSNFEKVKYLINGIVTLAPHLSGSEYGFLFYLLNQQYGHIRNGETKDGDYAGYGHISKALSISKKSAQIAANRLASKGIILKSPGNKYGNHYSFNEDYFKGQQGFTTLGLYFGMLKREVGDFGDRLIDYIWRHNPFLMVANEFIGG